jgi:hypothetical protein
MSAPKNAPELLVSKPKRTAQKIIRRVSACSVCGKPGILIAQLATSYDPRCLACFEDALP